MVNLLLLFLYGFWHPSQKHQEFSLYWPQKSLFPREIEYVEAPSTSSPGRNRPSVLTAQQRETAWLAAATLSRRMKSSNN